VAKLAGVLGKVSLADDVRRHFAVELTADQLRRLRGSALAVPAVIKASPPLYIASAPKPWRD
jgi:hypothetical protein